MIDPSNNARNLCTRRKAIRDLTAGALLSLGLWPGCARRNQPSSNHRFQFLVINDTHYMSEECGVWLERVVAQMRTHADAQFCLLAGDLVEKGHRPHLGAVRDIFSGLSIPTYSQIGNHDYLTDDDRTGYDAVYPGRVNYSFISNGCQFVGIDSTLGTKYENTTIQPATLQWIRQQAPRLKRDMPTILFTHFPLGAGVKYRPANADAALDPFREHNLVAVFNGHFHGSTERVWNQATVVTNKCCALKRNNHDGTKEKGYYLCTMENGVVTRQFVQMNAAA